MTEKLRLDLQILLPHVPDKADACVGRLIRELEGRDGIEQVHVRDGEDGTPAQVCIHYDAEMLPLARIREIVEGAGAEISGRYGHASWEVDGIVHQRRARTVGERLRALPGVLEAEASAAGRVAIEFDRERTSEQDLRKALAELKVVPRGQPAKEQHAHAEGDHDHDHEAGDHKGHAHGGLLGPNT